ncbi:DUF302 domain-containing protein, partial [Rhizobium leguminosarum bv. viciae]
MTYTLDRTLWATSFDDAVGRTKSALSKHGFGVLTEIGKQGRLAGAGKTDHGGDTFVPGDMVDGI